MKKFATTLNGQPATREESESAREVLLALLDKKGAGLAGREHIAICRFPREGYASAFVFTRGSGRGGPCLSIIVEPYEPSPTTP